MTNRGHTDDKPKPKTEAKKLKVLKHYYIKSNNNDDEQHILAVVNTAVAFTSQQRLLWMS